MNNHTGLGNHKCHYGNMIDRFPSTIRFLMYLFTVINTVCDLALLCLLLSISRGEDQSHPMAPLITITAAPYFAHLYPTIIHATTFTMQSRYMIDVYEIIYNQQRIFESIMLSTVILTILFGGTFCVDGIIRAYTENQMLTTCQIRRRIITPFCFSLAISMAHYNGLLAGHQRVFGYWKDLKFDNLPLFMCFSMSTMLLAMYLCYASVKLRSTLEITATREMMIKIVNSFQIFFLVSIVPIAFLMYQMTPMVNTPFFISDYHNFVRLIFVFAVLVLEPYSGRLKLRDRFYRTGVEENHFVNNSQSTPQIVSTTSQADKRESTDPPPMYAPPSYEAANNLMTPAWASPIGAENDKGIAPVQTF